MVDEPSGGILQVELNTIASSFGCLSTQVARMHRFIIERANLQEAFPSADLPVNTAMASISEALAAAVRVPSGEGESAMLMIVQPGERNAFDQQWLQTQLWEKHQIRTIRKSLREVRGILNAMRYGC